MRSLNKGLPVLRGLLLLLLTLSFVVVAVEEKEDRISSAAPIGDFFEDPAGHSSSSSSSLPSQVSDGAIEFPFKDKHTHKQWSDGLLHPKYLVTCSSLRLGQFRCNDSLHIDPETQQLRGCNSHNVAPVPCTAAKGLVCRETNSSIFTKQFPCKYTNGYRYDTALLLSVFLGWLGADRLYLGHVGMGAVKMVTLGFFFIGHLVDIILVATQTVRPIDSSHYIVGFYGPSVQSVRADNLTLIVRRPDWFTE